jgi:hypothetical protein
LAGSAAEWCSTASPSAYPWMTGLSGFSTLEFRLQGRARATKDLDLAVTSSSADGPTVLELLIGWLSEDPDGHWFSFRVKEPAALAADGAGRGAWRFSVEAWLAGQVFTSIRWASSATRVARAFGGTTSSTAAGGLAQNLDLVLQAW